MKKTLIAAAAALALAAPAHAVDEQRPERLLPVAAQAPEKTVEQMKANVDRMKSQLDRMAAAKTPEERQKLFAEHMQTMRENMMLGQQMSAGDTACPMYGAMGGYGPGMGMMGMMGPGGQMMGPGGMMMGPGWGGGNADAMMNRMQHMERRLDMMQQLLERQTGTPQQR